jgi:transketolase
MTGFGVPRDAYGEVLSRLGETRKDLVVLDADLSSSTKTSSFGKKFPDRFFNIGIAEQNMIGIAAGLATTGKTVFASSFAMFAVGRVYDQIRQSVAYPKTNVKIVATHAGITVGEDGVSHQMIEDISLMCALPNMKVMVPADTFETRKTIREISLEKGPTYVRLGRSKVSNVFESEDEIKLGKATTLLDGDDVTIIASGVMVSKSLEAAQKLQKEGISAGVLNLSTLKPIDRQGIIKSAKKTGCVVTAEEHNIYIGMGALVSSILSEEYPVPILRCGIKDTFAQSADYELLMQIYNLTSDEIYKLSKNVITMKR